MKRERAAASSVVLLLAGCAVVESSTGTSGLAYHLPKGYISITTERKNITTDEAAAAHNAASSAAALVEADKKALAAAKESLKTNQGASADDPSNKTLQEKTKLDQALVNYLTAALKGDQQRAEEAKAIAADLANAVGKMQETRQSQFFLSGRIPARRQGLSRTLTICQHGDDGMKLLPSFTMSRSGGANLVSILRALDDP